MGLFDIFRKVPRVDYEYKKPGDAKRAGRGVAREYNMGQRKGDPNMGPGDEFMAPDANGYLHSFCVDDNGIVHLKGDSHGERLDGGDYGAKKQDKTGEGWKRKRGKPGGKKGKQMHVPHYKFVSGRPGNAFPGPQAEDCEHQIGWHPPYICNGRPQQQSGRFPPLPAPHDPLPFGEEAMPGPFGDRMPPPFGERASSPFGRRQPPFGGRMPPRPGFHPSDQRSEPDIGRGGFPRPFPSRSQSAAVPPHCPPPVPAGDPMVTAVLPLGARGKRVHVAGQTRLNAKQFGPTNDPGANFKYLQALEELRKQGGG